MDFIFTSFLWFLPLASIPILIHVFNKLNIQTVEFSSIRFLKLIESDSINNLKLLQLLLLIIRTLIILFIILMLARPTVKGLFSNFIYDNESTVSIIYYDDTSSNMGTINNSDRSNLIESYIQDILLLLKSNSNIIVISQTKGLIYSGVKKNIKNIFPIKISQMPGNLYDNLFSIENYIDKEYINKEIFIISDGEKSFFEKFENLKEQLSSYYFYFIQLPKIKNNYSIIDVSLENDNIAVDSEIVLDIKVKNNGQNVISNALLELKIDGINVGQQLVTLDPNITKTYTFKTSLASAGIHKCLITLPEDDNSLDNSFYYLIDIPKKININILNNKNIYINESMQALSKITDNINIKFDNSISINEDDIIILSKDSEISKKLLLSYIENGGHAIYFPKSDDIDYPNYLYEFLEISKNEIKQNNTSFYNQIDTTSKAISFLKNNYNNLEFYRYIPLDININTMLKLNNQKSIWNRFDIDNGIIDVFAFSNDLNWTNFPIKGSYISFLNQLIYSTYKYNNLNLSNGSDWIPKIPNSFLNTLVYFNLNFNNSKIINTKDPLIIIPEKGFHDLSTSNQKIIEIASNINTDELKNIILNKKQIENYFPNKFLYIEDDILSSIQISKYGNELWRFLLYIVIILVIIEMILSNGKRFQK